MSSRARTAATTAAMPNRLPIFGAFPIRAFPQEAVVTQPSAEATITRATDSSESKASATTHSVMIYGIAFVTGAIVMSFEMLGSRYLNPYFGSGIYTWASLISTVLMALTLGYFLGGWLADRTASLSVLAVTVLVASLYMLVLPSFAQPLLELLLADIDDVRTGSLVASLAILLFPVTFFGMYSPFAIRLMLRSAQSSGMVSGTVYGVSTFGSIVGTLGTTFFLIPTIGTRAITLWLGAAGVACGLILLAAGRVRTQDRRGRRRAAARVRRHRRPCPWLRQRRADRRERARRDPQAQGRPARPCRERVQRHLHQQAAQPADHDVPAQGLGLHGIGRPISRTPTTCRCTTRR